jgi:hypothetical protein
MTLRYKCCRHVSLTSRRELVCIISKVSDSNSVSGLNMAYNYVMTQPTAIKFRHTIDNVRQMRTAIKCIAIAFTRALYLMLNTTICCYGNIHV